MTKTFDDIMNEGYTFPAIIPPDLQLTIYDWYKYRNVCDDDKFVDFFNRLLRRDYPRYFELLRIEPGVSQYDWLVSRYHELQREVTDEKTTSTTGGNTVTETTSEVTDGTESGTKTGTDTDTGTVNHTNSSEKTVREVYNQDDSVSTSRTDTTDSTTTDRGTGDNKHVERAMPMQAANIGTGTSSPSGIGVVSSLIWDSASAQAEDSNENYKMSDTDTTLSVDGTDVLDRDGERNVTETNSGGILDTYNKSYGKSESTSKDTDISKSGSRSVTGSNTGSESSEGNGRIREIMTGRNAQVANMLENAKDFIVKTNAWEWLESRINTVFMGVYEI